MLLNKLNWYHWPIKQKKGFLKIKDFFILKFQIQLQIFFRKLFNFQILILKLKMKKEKRNLKKNFQKIQLNKQSLLPKQNLDVTFFC